MSESKFSDSVRAFEIALQEFSNDRIVRASVLLSCAAHLAVLSGYDDEKINVMVGHFATEFHRVKREDT